MTTASAPFLWRHPPRLVKVCDNPPVTCAIKVKVTGMSSAKKKVILRRFMGEVVHGYLPLSGFTRSTGDQKFAQLLDLSGRLLEFPLNDVKMISYVRDFNLQDTVNPERLTRRAFLSRPRTEGVWVRVTFRSTDRSGAGSADRTLDALEGLAASDLSLFDSLIEDSGLHFSPPDIRSNTQRIFIPRPAIETMQILAVITTPSKIKPLPPPAAEKMRKEMQESLFDAVIPRNQRPN